MKRFAILSDIHANLEALEAVLRDVDARQVDALLVLGDTLGYGPNPAECLELVTAAADVVLLGNHEKEAIAPEPDELSDDAREMLGWQLSALEGSAAWDRMRADVASMPFNTLCSRRLDGFRLFHGSPEHPGTEYVWPGHPSHFVHLNRQLDERVRGYLQALEETHGFCGHTHVPSVLTDYANRDLFEISMPFDPKRTFIGPGSVFFVPKRDCVIEGLAGRKIIVNPGSVGQPRDGNPEASWALYDGDSVEFRRVAYDFRRTQQKILALPVADETRRWFAHRLGLGE